MNTADDDDDDEDDDEHVDDDDEHVDDEWEDARSTVRGVLAETDVPYRAEGHCFCTFVHPPRSYVPACQVTDSSSRCGGQSECHPDDGTKNDLNRLFRVFSNNRRAGSIAVARSRQNRRPTRTSAG